MSPSASPHDQILKAAAKQKAELGSAAEETEPDLSLDLKEHQIKSLQQELQEAQDTHKTRLKYVSRIFWLVCGWLVCVAFAVFFAGWSFKAFNLSDQVLIAFITSTTINVVGLFVVVAKWLFPNGNGNKKAK